MVLFYSYLHSKKKEPIDPLSNYRQCRVAIVSHCPQSVVLTSSYSWGNWPKEARICWWGRGNSCVGLAMTSVVNVDKDWCLVLSDKVQALSQLPNILLLLFLRNVKHFNIHHAYLFVWIAREYSRIFRSTLMLVKVRTQETEERLLTDKWHLQVIKNQIIVRL